MGSAGPQSLRRHLVAHELGIDAALADASGDQLRILAAQINDENRALLRRRLGERDDLSAVDSSAIPS